MEYLKPDDFQYLRYFQASEVTNTGAELGSVQLELMHALDAFRRTLGRPVVLLPNGLTTGNHKAIAHRQGMAADVAIRESEGSVDVQLVFKAALVGGFKGIGIYWNDAAYSFHLELSVNYRFWVARKKHRETHWVYEPLIKDPRID
jgi:hypothetical protein